MRRPLATLMLCLYLLGSYAYSNRRITVSDGLSNNLVLCMAIDNDGYVWAGTESGLNRIGGGICTQIRPPLGWEHGFRGNADKVLSLYYDQQNGTLFVGTESGLDIVDSRTGIYRRAVGDSLPNYGIPDMGTDHHGGVWLFYNNGLIQRVGCGDLKVTTLPRTNGMGYYSGTDDGNGLLYTGHSKGGMDIVDSKTGLAIGTFVHEQGNESSLPGNNVRCIFQDRNRRIWVGTDHGLALFHPAKGIFQRIRHSGSLYDDNVYDIREMADGRLWVACDVGGIGIVDPMTMAYTEECPDGLSSLNTRSLLQDGYGNVWVGHHSTGIDVLSAGEPLLRQQPYTSAKGSMLAVGAICSDAAGRLWVNAEDELSLWQGEHKLAVWQIQGLRSHAHSFARSMMVGKDGRVWLGMEDEGVIRFDPATGRFEHIDIGYDAPDTHCFFEDEDGSIWIGTDFGVCTYKGGTVCHEENVTRVTRSAPVNSFLRMGETLLMATMGNGVILYNTQTGDHRKVEANYGLPTRNISQALADGHGGVWLATNKGIFFLPDIKNEATSVCYDKRQGLADQQVQAIALDHEGRLWASTFTHIACLDSGKERLFHNYDGYAQLTTGGFAVGAVAQTSGGVLAFGSTNGICFVRPQVANDDQDTVRPKIAVCNIYQPTADDMNTTALLSDNEGRLSLNYQQNTI